MTARVNCYMEDGTVLSSSQHQFRSLEADQGMHPLVGIILSVVPADAVDNYTALQSDDFRGIRHECTVLATDHIGQQPDILIKHVTVPPGRHSGVDNYEEDLPRGCSELVDGSTLSSDFSKVNYAKLDGEWCLIGFIGGRIELPFIMGWWPHPSNPFDLATSGHGYKEKALVQTDIKKNRSRFIRRVNGTIFAINKTGDVYLDTTEANSQVSIKDGKLTRKLVDKGGHVQVDVGKTCQLEINFNEKEHQNPRLGAGSTKSTPVTDVDLPHPDQPVTGSPKTRATKRTYRRSKEWETLEKTSSFNLFCENTESDGGKKGECAVKAEDTISIVVSKGTAKGTMINIAEGKLQIWSNDGSQINVLSDEIQIVTKSGGVIDLKGSTMTVSGKVNITGPLAIGGVGVPPVLGPPFLTDLGTDYLAKELACASTTYAQWQALDAATKAPPLTPLNPPFAALATAWQKYVEAITAFMTKAALPPPANTYLAKNTTTT